MFDMKVRFQFCSFIVGKADFPPGLLVHELLPDCPDREERIDTVNKVHTT